MAKNKPENSRQQKQSSPPTGQQNQFTDDDKLQFELLGMSPDPDKQYTIQEFEAARDREYNRVANKYPGEHDQGIREQERSKIRVACERLSDKFCVNKAQKKAKQEGGASQAWERHQKDAKQHYQTDGKYASVTNAVSSSYALFWIMETYLDAHSSLFPAFPGRQFSPEGDTDKVLSMPEDDQKVRQELDGAAQRMGIEIEYDHENPNIVRGINGPDYTNCTEEQKKARDETCKKYHAEAQKEGVVTSSPAPS